MHMNRRDALAVTLLPMSGFAIAQADLVATRLRAGACALLLRHAQTDPGIGDPPGFQLDVCSTQRNLSSEAKAQSLRIGQWFRGLNLQPAAIQSSAWCRCKDTADLAFDRHTVWPALNSFFEGPAAQTAQTSNLRDRLRGIPAGRFEVWVTHQVNITALTGEYAAMGEALVVNAQGQMTARRTFA